jgi:hypothetical protein
MNGVSTRGIAQFIGKPEKTIGQQRRILVDKIRFIVEFSKESNNFFKKLRQETSWYHTACMEYAITYSSNEEIADKLGISVWKVKQLIMQLKKDPQCRVIMRKFRVGRRYDRMSNNFHDSQ